MLRAHRAPGADRPGAAARPADREPRHVRGAWLEAAQANRDLAAHIAAGPTVFNEQPEVLRHVLTNPRDRPVILGPRGTYRVPLRRQGRFQYSCFLPATGTMTLSSTRSARWGSPVALPAGPADPAVVTGCAISPSRRARPPLPLRHRLEGGRDRAADPAGARGRLPRHRHRQPAPHYHEAGRRRGARARPASRPACRATSCSCRPSSPPPAGRITACRTTPRRRSRRRSSSRSRARSSTCGVDAHRLLRAARPVARASGLGADDREAWRAMEALHARRPGAPARRQQRHPRAARGAVRARRRVPPAFVQNRCYARDRLGPRRPRASAAQRGIVYQGFSLLTANRHELAQRPPCSALAARHGRTPAQVVFRFALQVGMLPAHRHHATPRTCARTWRAYDFELSRRGAARSWRAIAAA